MEIYFVQRDHASLRSKNKTHCQTLAKQIIVPGIKKLYHQLKLRRIDTLVYTFNLHKDTIPALLPKTTVATVVQEKPGKMLFSASVDGMVVNKNYTYKKNLLSRQLSYGHMPLIGGCSTIVPYRGQGIYPYMLTRILEWYRQNTALPEIAIFVAPDNISSIKGIEKAGFTFIENVTIYRLLGICIFKKVHAAAPSR